jgi:hypothetical protein
MSTFGGLILTDNGRNLQAKAQTGIQLNYTRIALGDGDMGSTQISELNSLINQKHSLEISKLKVYSGGRAVVGTVLTNQDLTEGFYFREIGVFATDPDLGEILYCYGNAGALAEYIPPGNGSDKIEKTIDIQTIVGNAQNVTATINESLVYATVDQLNDHVNNSTIHVTIADKEKLAGIEAGANKYVHPSNHPASMITVADANSLFTANDVEGALSELFTNVSNGKDLVGTAITDVDNSLVVPTDPTFQNLADLIRGIETGKKRANGTITADSNGNLIVNNLRFTPKMVSIYRGTSDLIVLTHIFDTDGLNQGELWSGGLNFSYDYYNSLPSNPNRAFTFYPGGFHVTDVNDVGVWNYIAYEE